MRQVKLIPIEKCVVPPVRITAVYDDELAAMLKDSLGAMGQIVPIVVVETDGVYVVADGKHRLDEAKARGDKTIPAVVREGNPEDVMLLNLVTNRTRGKVKASELVAVVNHLNEICNLDSDQIATRTGISRDTIEKYLFVAKGSPEVREALDAEVIGIGHAFEIARLPNHIQQAEILAKYQVWRWPVSQLREQIDVVLRMMEPTADKPATEQKPARPTTIPCNVCNAQQEPKNLRPVLLCPECFGLTWKLKHEPAAVATS